MPISEGTFGRMPDAAASAPTGDPLPTRIRRAPIPAAAKVYDLGRPITAEEFQRLPRRAERQELLDGRVVETCGIVAGHGKSRTAAMLAFAAWQDQKRTGHVLPGVGFILSRGPDLVRAPDVAFIHADRVPPDHDENDYLKAAPDFAFEVKSASYTMPELRAKAEEYLSFRVQLIWLLDRNRRVVEVYRPGQPPASRGEADALDGGDVLPGFSCKVADLLG